MLALSLPNEGYSRNALCTLLISTFFFIRTFYKTHYNSQKKNEKGQIIASAPEGNSCSTSYKFNITLFILFDVRYIFTFVISLIKSDISKDLVVV
jgi:NADH:ubiquinone oxidoreductase subunit 3 (subunit A)